MLARRRQEMRCVVTTILRHNVPMPLTTVENPVTFFAYYLNMGTVLFKLYDQDHDGRMSSSELARAMQLACQALPQDQLDQLVQAIMEVFDTDKDGYLNFGEFSALMSNSGLELNV
ncbi:hypothetical protein Mapa_014282 [Marchantia paleacea]|nr:hypothetical protein Mapa_014282 [Marchantia paleacea]